MAVVFPFYLHRPAGPVEAENQQSLVGDLIQQLLFTSPGERVNRPDFGCGLLQLTFGGLSDVLETTLEATVAGALQYWLRDMLQGVSVTVTGQESTLTVTVRYIDLTPPVQQEVSVQA